MRKIRCEPHFSFQLSVSRSRTAYFPCFVARGKTFLEPKFDIISAAVPVVATGKIGRTAILPVWYLVLVHPCLTLGHCSRVTKAEATVFLQTNNSGYT